MKSHWCVISAAVLACFICNCGTNPARSSQRGSGQLQVWAHVPAQNGLSKCAKTTATTWDSLVVRITSSDMDTLQRSFPFASSDAYVNCTLSDVPAGKGRCIDVWTKNRGGVLIHAGVRKKTDIASGEIILLDFSLTPKRGSIYVDISNIPVTRGADTIVRVFAAFRFNSQMVSDSAVRGKSVFLSLDNIPDSASGIVDIWGIGSAMDTLYRCSCPLTFLASRDTTFSIKATTVSTGVSLNLSVANPGVTVITTSLDTGKIIGPEHGPLIISEIMYAANDSEYIEVYNPLDKDSAFDTLILDIDGTYRSFSPVTVPAHGFFVFGRKNLPWVNAVHPVSSALDLLSGGGNCLVLRAKDSTVMDWVTFLGAGNTQGWPSVGSAKKAIVLDSLCDDPTYNNYGKHWVAATTAINLTDPKNAVPVTAQCGTPGFRGR